MYICIFVCNFKVGIGLNIYLQQVLFNLDLLFVQTLQSSSGGPKEVSFL